MKTEAEIKQAMEKELAAFEAKMEKMRKELEEVTKGLPDFVRNFDPFEIKKVLDFFEANTELLTVKPKYFDADDFVYNVGDSILFDKYAVEVVDQQGGGEGSGEHWHSVFKVMATDEYNPRYYYIPGYYASYDGTDIEWDSIYEVEPYEKMVIDWRAK